MSTASSAAASVALATGFLALTNDTAAAVPMPESVHRFRA